MPLFTDQLGRTVELTATPSRIVSLVPSQTELLYDLGLNEEVVGITKFCIHPQEWFTTKTRIGGTKNLNLPKIRSLQPDLIIANKEENVQDQVKALAAEYPVWISDVNDLPTAFDMISAVGKLVGSNEQARTIRSGINTKFQELIVWLQ
jgi:ABC-type Fe3+-hydroxamate transport system substrate-binding protein